MWSHWSWNEHFLTFRESGRYICSYIVNTYLSTHVLTISARSAAIPKQELILKLGVITKELFLVTQIAGPQSTIDASGKNNLPSIYFPVLSQVSYTRATGYSGNRCWQPWKTPEMGTRWKSWPMREKTLWQTLPTCQKRLSGPCPPSWLCVWHGVPEKWSPTKWHARWNRQTHCYHCWAILEAKAVKFKWHFHN